MQRATAANESQTASYPTFQAGRATLDLLIYYEEGFQEDPSVVADFLIEETNKYLSNSKIDLRVSLAGLRPLAISAAEEQGDVLRSMYRGESPFTDIASDGAYFGADVVFALRQNRPEGMTLAVSHMWAFRMDCCTAILRFLGALETIGKFSRSDVLL